MTTKNKIIMLMYALVGLVIGILASRHYIDTNDGNKFFVVLCIILGVIVFLYVSKISYNNIPCSAFILLVLWLFKNPISWGVTWGVCALQLIMNIIWWILSTIGKFFTMLF